MNRSEREPESILEREEAKKARDGRRRSSELTSYLGKRGSEMDY